MKQKQITAGMITHMSRQSLKSSRMRNIFIMVTIVLASALLTAILMFATGQEQQTKNELSHRQQVGFYNLTDEQMEMLKQDERLAYQVQVKTGILSEMGGFDVMPYYVSELSDQIRIAELESGAMPEAENEIALQAPLLDRMGIQPAVGSSVTFTFYDGNTETFTVSGILKGGETTKQFAVFLSKSYAEHGSQLKEVPYEVYARLDHADSFYAQSFRETVYQIGSDVGMERKYVVPSKAFLDSLSIDTQSVMLYGLVGAIILLACALVIYGVFYLSVVGKIHQFGQLRTIGMTKKQMKRFVSREGGILFLSSAPIGILIGGVAGFFMIPNGFDILNTAAIVLLVFVIIYLITIISIRKPARLAAAVSPMEALRYVPEGMKQKTNRAMCRNLSPFGLGLLNFSKNGKKAVITMLSLALGGILFMTAATYMSSFDKANYARQGYFTDAEFHIEYASSAISLDEYGQSGLQAKSPLGDELIQQIYALNGVKRVDEVKGFGVKFDYPVHDEYDNDDVVLPLTEEETTTIGSYLKDGDADYEKLMSGDYVLVAGNDNAEEIYGWSFTVGDTIVLHYYDGTQTAEHSVTILGVLNNQYILDHNGLEGWFLMPEQAILNLVSFESLNSHLLVSTEADQEETIGERLAELIADMPELTLETLAERRVIYEQNANQLFGAISGLSVFIMLFSILSMMNTLITNIVTRKQELAMLESIGMSKKQIRSMLCGESLFFVFVTIVITMSIGTLCGYLLSNTLYRAGAFYMAFRFPAALALSYVGVLIAVPLLITLVSMHSFSKEALVERLRGMEN